MQPRGEVGPGFQLPCKRGTGSCEPNRLAPLRISEMRAWKCILLGVTAIPFCQSWSEGSSGFVGPVLLNRVNTTWFLQSIGSQTRYSSEESV